MVQRLDDEIVGGDPVCGNTCTLRDAIRTAATLPGPDTIVFADGLSGELALVATLSIQSDVTIEGPGADQLTIRVEGSDIFNRRVFAIANGSTVTLRGMTIQRTGTGSGGGIENFGNLTLEDVVVASSDYNGNGGALYNSGVLTVVDSVLRDNRGVQGGGIYNAGHVVLRDSRISGSNARSISGEGTAIRNGGGVIFLIEQSTISNNRADEDSEGIANDNDRCGGFLNQGHNASAEAPTTMTIRNSTSSGNRALRSGGGLCAITGFPNTVKVTIIHSTIADNLALDPRNENEGGGGIFIHNCDVTLVNSIVAGNYRGNKTALDNILRVPDYSGTVTTQGVNMSDTQPQGFGANDLTNQAALLGSLADNGGPTFTHALLAGSPALDAASGDLCLEVDQRGESRPADGNDDSNAVCDIGACEAQGAPPAIDYEETFLPFIAQPESSQPSAR